jgi:hypothetical protein
VVGQNHKGPEQNREHEKKPDEFQVLPNGYHSVGPEKPHNTMDQSAPSLLDDVSNPFDHGLTYAEGAHGTKRPFHHKPVIPAAPPFRD